MATYKYNDSSLVENMDSEELDHAETQAILEVDKLGITDEFYKERAVVAKVYVTLATLQLDNDGDGTKEKLKAYANEFKRYIDLAKTKSSVTSVSTISLARG